MEDREYFHGTSDLHSMWHKSLFRQVLDFVGEYIIIQLSLDHAFVK